MSSTGPAYTRKYERGAPDEQSADCKRCPHRFGRERCELRLYEPSSSKLVTSIITLPRQTALFKQGDRVRSLYVVCWGYMKLSVNCGQGQQMVIRIAGPGSMLGLNSALMRGVFEVSAESITNSIVRAVDRDIFLDFLGAHGETQTGALESLRQSYGSALEAASRLGGNRTASERVGSLLVALSGQMGGIVNGTAAGFPLLLTHDELSSMAGTTRETVTRALNQFRKEGWISINGGWITIHSPENVQNVDAFKGRERVLKECRTREQLRAPRKIVTIDRRSKLPAAS